MSGMQTYSNLRIPLKIRKEYAELAMQPAIYGSTTFTAKNYTEYFSVLQSDLRVFEYFAQNMTVMADPRTIPASYLIQYFHRILFKKVNRELLDFTSYKLHESLKSCLFNLTYDCKEEKDLISSQNSCLSCFTFNRYGSKYSSSPRAGLDLV